MRGAAVACRAMTDHAEAAREHLEKALEAADGEGPWFDMAAAGVHAVLHLADNVRHGLRDLMYELRD